MLTCLVSCHGFVSEDDNLYGCILSFSLRVVLKADFKMPGYVPTDARDSKKT